MKLQLVGAMMIGGVLGGVAMAQPAGETRSGEFNTRVAAPPEGNGDNVFFAPNKTVQFISSEMNFNGKAVTNAPYSAEAVTETTQRLADGNRISHKSTATMYRDSEGRTRREDSIGAIGPWANANEPLRTVFINDPVAGTNLILEPHRKTARKMKAPAFKTTGGKMVMEHGGVAASAGQVQIRSRSVQVNDGAPVEDVIVHAIPAMPGLPGMAMPVEKDAKRESLGKQVMEGVAVEGTRTVMTIAAGAMGNDLPIEIVSERWYSPELQAVVMSRTNDPRMGETVYRLSNIRREEPARNLFEAPPDYTLKEEQPFFREFKYEKK
jgi:hypothetical protein